MSYNAKVSFAFETSEGSSGVAVKTVNVKKKSDDHVILALKRLLGRAHYYLIDVEWEQA